MTCTACTDLEFAVAPKAPGFAARLLKAISRLRPVERLDLDSLSCHRLRDLGLSDGRDVGPRNYMRD